MSFYGNYKCFYRKTMEVRSQILRKAFGCMEEHCFNTGEKLSHTRTVVRECCKGDDASQ